MSYQWDWSAFLSLAISFQPFAQTTVDEEAKMSALWRLEAERIAGELTAMRAKEREE